MEAALNYLLTQPAGSLPAGVVCLCIVELFFFKGVRSKVSPLRRFVLQTYGSYLMMLFH